MEAQAEIEHGMLLRMHNNNMKKEYENLSVLVFSSARD